MRSCTRRRTRARRESVELHNLADSTAYRAEKLLEEQGEKIEAELKVEVEGKIKAVRGALQAESQDAAGLRGALEELDAALMKVGEKVYAAAEGEAGAAAEGEAGAAAEGEAGAAAEGEAGATEGEAGATEGEEAGTVEGEFREV